MTFRDFFIENFKLNDIKHQKASNQIYKTTVSISFQEGKEPKEESALLELSAKLANFLETEDFLKVKSNEDLLKLLEVKIVKKGK